MEHSFQTIKEWMARFKMDDPLLPNDPRCLDLQHFQFDGKEYALHGRDWIKPLRRCIQLHEGESCQLFSGFRGTGKSTELLRLQTQLEKDGYTVLLIDLFDYHDMEHLLAIEDLVVILAAAVGDWANKQGLDSITDEFWEELSSFFKTELALSEVKLKVKPVELKFGVRNAAPFWREARNKLATSLNGLVRRAHAFIEQKVEKIQKANHGNEVVLIFDSLEKLGGSETNFRDTMDSVIRVFSQYPSYLRLPKCHVIYTIPPYATIMDPQVEEYYDCSLLKPLPAIKITEKGPDGSIYEPGYAALRSLVDKRVTLDQLFGRDTSAIDRLIKFSGGHVRTLIRMMRELLLRYGDEPFPLGLTQVNGVIKDFQEKVVLSVRPEGVAMLDSIRKSNSITDVKNGELELLARYMDHHMVLCYQNGDGWFQLHELIKDDVKHRAARGDER